MAGGFREHDPDCPCCFDCEDLTQYPYQIWFDADANGSYELGPYPMTYEPSSDLYTYDFARVFGINKDPACGGSPTTRAISVCYFKIKQGASAGTHGVYQALSICKLSGLISGILADYIADPVPWTRAGLDVPPTLTPLWDGLSNGSYWLIVGTTTIDDPCSWLVTTGTGSVSIFGSTGLYNFRITRGSDPF